MENGKSSGWLRRDDGKDLASTYDERPTPPVLAFFREGSWLDSRSLKEGSRHNRIIRGAK